MGVEGQEGRKQKGGNQVIIVFIVAMASGFAGLLIGMRRGHRRAEDKREKGRNTGSQSANGDTEGRSSMFTGSDLAETGAGYATIQAGGTIQLSSKRSPQRGPIKEPPKSRVPVAISSSRGASGDLPGGIAFTVMESTSTADKAVTVGLQSTSSVERIVFGRGASSDVAIPHHDVSVRHMALARVETKEKEEDGGAQGEGKTVWGVQDVGSLNGTCVNCEPLPRCGRQPSSLREVREGDIIRLGEQEGSHEVRIERFSALEGRPRSLPCEWASAWSTSLERPVGSETEDAFLCEEPLRGYDWCSLFVMLDGHGGREAAQQAAHALPQHLSQAVSEEVSAAPSASGNEWASRSLHKAFARTDKEVTSENTGSTATALFVWREGERVKCMCANVGDSACLVGLPEGESNFSLEPRVMSECHRVNEARESRRLDEAGQSTNATGSRVMGLALSRVLGDKALKEHCPAIIAEPSISPAIDISSGGIALMASDGVWDSLPFQTALGACSVSGHVERMAHHSVRAAIQRGSGDDTTALALRISPVNE